jgi:hypothetical protein
MTTWKHAERQIAKRLGGRRVPVTGRAGQPDIAHPWLSIEVKHRRRLPQWLTMAMEQAEKVSDPWPAPVGRGARERDTVRPIPGAAPPG